MGVKQPSPPSFSVMDKESDDLLIIFLNDKISSFIRLEF